MAMAIAMAQARAMAMAMGMPMAQAMAMAQLKTTLGLTEGLSTRVRANLNEKYLSINKCLFSHTLVISGPSKPQNWMRIEIAHRKMVSGCLET